MDWTDETLTFCLRLRFFGTRIGWMGHGFFRLRRGGFFGRRIGRMKRIFSPAAFLDFIEWADLPYVAGPSL